MHVLSFKERPVKKMPWVLKEIPCHFMSQIHGSLKTDKLTTPNSMTIPCHLSRFYLFSRQKHDMEFGQVQVMEFPWYLLRK